MTTKPKTKPTPPLILYTVEQFSTATGICRTKVFELMKSGELETIRIGRSRRIPVSAAMSWIEEKLSA